MPYSSPASVSDGNVAPASWGNSVKAATDFLANPPACRVTNSANISIVNNTETTLTFDTERFDTDSMHSTVTNTGRITCVTAGLYQISFSFRFPTQGVGMRYGIIWHSSAGALAGNSWAGANITIDNITSISTLWKMAVGEWVEARVYQSTGGPLNASKNSSDAPEFSAVWVGLG